MDKIVYYSTLIAFVFVIMFAILFSWWQSDTSEISGRCNLEGIELINVSPYECWSNDFVAEYCPKPKKIDCSFEVKGLADILMSFVKQLD